MDQHIHEKIHELTQRINELARQQTSISQQLVQLINELEALKLQVGGQESRPVEQQKPVEHQQPIEQFNPVTKKIVETNVQIEAPRQVQRPSTPPPPQQPLKSTTFEEFIGKNVASKVGILILIIGVFIGAKYAIDHELISPLMRVILGYVCGIALTGVAIKLKKKYESYSAVLMGGGLAVLYFITYIAYSYYELLPQVPAFVLMLVFTAATVYASLSYDLVIIAHLGMVGAYAIPFLLSNNKGQYSVLFTYIAIINSGVLIVSFKKYWKSLFYVSFGLTWIIYLFWFAWMYTAPQHTVMAWTFLVIYFLLFYATFLAYKLIKKEQYAISDVLVLLVNAFAFYGIGYALLYESSGHNENAFAGLFTLANAGIHLVVSQVIRKLKLADRALYYLVLGLVIVFCTIAVPVQLDGNWVTLLWTAEALLVFFIGRTRQAPAYEKLGVGLAILGFGSLMQDWYNHSERFLQKGSNISSFLNIIFASGLLIAAAQGAILYLHRNKQYQSQLKPQSIYLLFYNYVLPVLFLLTVYFTFNVEINGYFAQLDRYIHGADGSFGVWGNEVDAFSFITQFAYTILFVTVVAVVNNRRIHSVPLSIATLFISALLLFVLLSQAYAVLNGLAVNYFIQERSGFYFGAWNVIMRYVVMVLMGALLYTGRQTVLQPVQLPVAIKSWILVIHLFFLSVLSAEYLLWTSISGAGNEFKLGLSIVWGVYALFLIVLGIRNKIKQLRLAAIVLFFITLLKLFLYDLSDAGTITKTISFISLGVILLLVSFLYNKYKDVLFGDDVQD